MLTWHLPAVAALLLAAPLLAQGAGDGPAATYLERYEALRRLTPAATATAKVQNLTIRRDAGEIVLEDGTLVLLEPIAGEVRGAVFQGKGRFHFRPTMEIERQRMRVFWKRDTLVEPFTSLVLLFADQTLEELSREVQFGPGQVPGELRHRLRESLDYIGDEGKKTLDPDILRPFLNAERTGLFHAFFVSDHRDPWMFTINPHEFEAVQLSARAERTGWGRYAESVAQFPREGDTVRVGGRGERRPEARVARYQLHVRLPQTGTGELAFGADGTLDVTADTTAGPWIAFYLFGKLQVDSVRWEGGGPAEFFKGKDTSVLWVRMERPLTAGEVRRLRIAYHGDLIDRVGDWFFIKSSIAWYPLSLDSRRPAHFELTFDSPTGMTLASIGEQVDSAEIPGTRLVRTRWVSRGPMRNAAFNLGVFDVHTATEEGAPPVTVLWSDQMHKLISQGGRVLAGKNMKQQVGGDITSAMKFYAQVFGEPPVPRFYATEIPAYHGEAWPGIVGLSFVTFQQTSSEGHDEVFRAHEVAHQWWGIGVDYATYRDRWLSEGFSNFSGLWYLQARRGKQKSYFGILREWKSSVMLRRDSPLPVWLGHRVATISTPEDYSALVYEKGAWVLHMLRILLLDVKTMNEDRFTAVMQEYYRRFRGGAASTADFQRVVEDVTGQDMRWFFDQWIYGTGIPTYKVAWTSEAAPDGTHQVRIRVRQERVPPGWLAYVPVTVDLGNHQEIRLRVKVTGAQSDITLPPLPAKPRDLRFNDLEGVLAEVKNERW